MPAIAPAAELSTIEEIASAVEEWLGQGRARAWRQRGAPLPEMCPVQSPRDVAFVSLRALQLAGIRPSLEEVLRWQDADRARVAESMSPESPLT